ncbi:MAG: hypothetical protein A2Y93_06400 [Chloroflexi bacterium RBG_13_68_17]|nr:MAG: hypothetical protein A2Y93_06400 [Chloroflexi bacterium RBG_13_68_17]
MSPAEFRLRPAARSEAAVIRGMIRRARINPIGIDWRRFVVAVDESGSVVGCGQIKPHAGGSRELASIVVAEDWRGRGVARAVIEHLLGVADPPVWLTCRRDLVGLYERFGFREVGPEEPQPDHFRRVRRLFRGLERVAGLKITVMVWQGTAGEPSGCSLPDYG